MSSDGLKIGPVLLLMETDKSVVVAKVIDPNVLFGLVTATSDAFVLNKDVIVAYHYIRAKTCCQSSANVRSAPSAVTTHVYANPAAAHSAPSARATIVLPKRTFH